MVAAAFLFGGVVSAEGPDSVDPEDEPTRVVTHTVEDGQGRSVVWTCYIDLDHPHYSHHAYPQEDKINVEGEVNCDQLMNVISVRMTLWKQSCFWIFCSWNSIGDSGWEVYPRTNLRVKDLDFVQDGGF